MTKITIFKEESSETRLSITPTMVKHYKELGCDVVIEAGAGHDLFTDDDFSQQGATVSTIDSELFDTDLIIQVQCPNQTILKKIKPQTRLICLLDPFFNKKQLELVLKYNITCAALEFIPRSTYAQKMDVLSSQASLAGYVAVTLAASKISKVLPMMMTPAGTISPAKVFVIGAGVAGLQSIATAKRLGAQVDAFDTRPVVEEQVKSLGAKFLKVNLGQTGEDKNGYATELSKEQLSKQQDLMEKACQQADIVITTAQLFGKKAPILITNQMIKKMKKGSVIVDLAVETGGNVESSQLNNDVMKEGVLIIGQPHLARFVAKDASQVFATNIFHVVKELYNEEQKAIVIDKKNDIVNSIMATEQGEIIQPMLLDKTKGKQ